MGKLFSRFRANVSGPSSEDERYAFEIMPGKIVTYEVETTGVFFKKRHYKAVHTMPIDAATTTELWSVEKAGSAICDVTTGTEKTEYHVYGKAKEFETEVNQAKY